MKLSKTISLKASLLASVAVISQGPVSIALAQDEQSALAVDDSIVVTATRRSQNIKDVPIAVTAVTGEQLEQANVFDVQTLARVAPSFNIENAQSSATTFTFRIRGIGTTGQNVGFESSVGVFVDGVYLSRPGVALGDLVDIEQLEVLRGPQGTLFGRNTSAGAINVTTKKPDLEAPTGNASVSYGNFNFVNAKGALSFPIIQDVAGFRLAGSYLGHDGTATQAVSGREVNDRDRFLLRGQLYAEPTENISLRILGDYADTDEQCCDAILLGDTPLTTPNPAFGGLSVFGLAGLANDGGVPVSGQEALDNRIVANDSPFLDATEQWGVSAELNWDLGFANLTYIPAYRDYSAEFFNSTDTTALDIFEVAGPNGEPNTAEFVTHTHELRLQGEAFDGRLDWLVGGYYIDESIDQRVIITLGEDFQRNIGTLFIANPDVGLAFGNNPINVLAGGADATGDFAANDFSQDTEGFAFFTHNIISLTDRLDLTLGARFTSEEKTGGFSQAAAQSNGCLGVLGGVVAGTTPPALGPLALGLSCFPFSTVADLPGTGIDPASVPPAVAATLLPLPATFQTSFEDDAFSYTGKLSYALTDDVNTYFGYTRGFKSGGITLDATANVFGADPRFESETTDAFELGVKGSFFDGRLSANLAAFHTIIDNYQILNFTGVQFRTFTVPRALSTGVEVETVTRLTDELTLNVAATYLSARYPDDCADGASAVSIASGVELLCGSDLTAAPNFVGNFGATYDKPLGNGYRVFLSGNAKVETEQRTRTFPVIELDPSLGGGLAPAPFDVAPGNTKVDLRAGFGAEDRRWTIEGWVQNLTDNQTRQITFAAPLRGFEPLGIGAAGAFLEEPRLYGVTIRTQF